MRLVRRTAQAHRRNLEPFAMPCRTSPQGLHQWSASTAVTVARAWPSAVARASRGRAFAVRQPVLTFDQHGSIGDRAGEEGGQDRRRTRRLASLGGRSTAGWAPRLSSTTRSPGASVGPSPGFTEARDTSAAVAPATVIMAWRPCGPSAANTVTGAPSCWGTLPTTRSPLGARP
jgi:hypothetical protein